MQPILQTLSVEKTDRANGAKQPGTGAPAPEGNSFSKIVASQKNASDRTEKSFDEGDNPAEPTFTVASGAVAPGKTEFPLDLVERPFQESTKGQYSYLPSNKDELRDNTGSTFIDPVKLGKEGLAKSEPVDANAATEAMLNAMPGTGLPDAKARLDSQLMAMPGRVTDKAEAEAKSLVSLNKTDSASRETELATSLGKSNKDLAVMKKNDGEVSKQAREIWTIRDRQAESAARATELAADKVSERSSSVTIAPKNELEVAQKAEPQSVVIDRREPTSVGPPAMEENRSATGGGNRSPSDYKAANFQSISQNKGLATHVLPSISGAQQELSQTVSPAGLEVGFSETDELLRSTTVDRVRTEPVAAKSIINQVMHSVSRGPGDGVIEVRLQPEELGRVRLAMTPSEAGMTIQVSAERPETLELLRRNIEMLEASLKETGFSDLSFSFSQENGGSDADLSADEQPSRDREARPLESLVVEEVLRSQPLPTGRLDIRV